MTHPPPDTHRNQHPQTTTRRGRMSSAKRTAITDLGPRLTLPTDEPWSDAVLADAFGSSGPVLLDVGCGSGEATIHWARREPSARVIAVELHRPGIATLLAALERSATDNVRVVEGDVQHLLEEVVCPGSITEIRILFPDPWPKRRHLKRRLVHPAFVERCATALRAGGVLHVATDWDDYAEHVRTTVATEPRLAPIADAGRPPRPVTTYEERGVRAGRTITDLRYRRVPDA